MWQNRGFCATTRARVFWRRARFETDVPARRIAKIKSGANYCCSYGFGSLSSERSPNVTQRTNMEITSLACFRHLLIKGHCWVKLNTQILINDCSLIGEPATETVPILSQSSKRFGSGVVKSNGLWLGWFKWRPLFKSQSWTLWEQDSIEAIWEVSVDELVPM